jgi:hypothetical protein
VKFSSSTSAVLAGSCMSSEKCSPALQRCQAPHGRQTVEDGRLGADEGFPP